MDLETIVFAGYFFTRAAFDPPTETAQAWAHNITGACIFVMGVARFFFGV